jgi:hypothetical protein
MLGCSFRKETKDLVVPRQIALESGRSFIIDILDNTNYYLQYGIELSI